MSYVPRRTSYATVAAGTASTTGYPSYHPSRGSIHSQQQHNDPGSNDPTYSQSYRHQTYPVEMEGSSVEKVGAMGAILKHNEAGQGSTADLELLCPSYLRRTKYMERLEMLYKQRQHAAKELRANHHSSTNLGSRQTSSSNLAQQKLSSIPPRGIVADVIERNTSPTSADGPKPLPSRWNDGDKCVGVELHAGGLEMRYQGQARTPDDAAAVRSDHPISPQCGLYYYEVTVLSRGKEGLIGVGFSTPKPSLTRLPGWEQDSWGYHGDDGYIFACSASGKPYGPKFSSLDVIGCGINFRTGSAFFTKNGIYLGDAFAGIKTDRLYPSVGIKKPGEHLRANFGQVPFVFDIDSLFEREKKAIRQETYSMDRTTTRLFPDLDDTATIHELVSQYLAHEGFTGTASQFAQDVREQQKSLQLGDQAYDPPIPPEDPNVTYRQKIRASILAGNIDQAFKYLNTYFPTVMTTEANRDIYFRLRCRKFIEMILRSYEMQSALSSDGMDTTTNGHENNSVSLDPDAMEMSTDTLPRPSFAETKSSTLMHNDLLTEAIQYGMELQGEFSDDPRKEVKKALSDTFALIAYDDARESVFGARVMEGGGRVEIAEQVNGAILVSLGKPRSALLEKLCAQTEVLLDMLGEKDGTGTFVNLRQDVLQNGME